MVGSDIQQKGEAQNFGHEWGEPSTVRPLVANPDPPIKNILRSVLGFKNFFLIIVNENLLYLKI